MVVSTNLKKSISQIGSKFDDFQVLVKIKHDLKPPPKKIFRPFKLFFYENPIFRFFDKNHQLPARPDWTSRLNVPQLGIRVGKLAGPASYLLFPIENDWKGLQRFFFWDNDLFKGSQKMSGQPNFFYGFISWSDQNPCDILIYWLVHRDPYSGFL